MDAFLEGLSIPKLKMANRNWLEAQISTKEVLEVIKQAKGGSPPGPDGFSALHYKKIAASLFLYLAYFFNSLQTGCS